jgi:opacity protein-like surface antigen
LVFCTVGYGEEKSSYFHKNNALGFKLGYHFFESSDFTNFWEIDEGDMNSFAFELAYERKINPTLGIELSVGYFKSDETYHNVLFVNDSSDIEIENYYLSPSLKCHIPVIKTLFFYFGGGPDLYYSEGNYKYNTTGYSYDVNDNFVTFGLHGLAGIEWYFYTHPARNDMYDAPVSLILEYKYSWVEINDADKKAIDDVNGAYGSNLSNHDLDVGGHMVFIGMRWHF